MTTPPATTPFDRAPQSLDEVDITSPDGYAYSGYPHAHWAYLRRRAPVFYYQAADLDPFWAITSYELIQQVSRDPQTFSNKTNIVLRLDQYQDDGAAPRTHHLLDMDPPEHGQYRALVNRRFTRGGLKRLEARIDEVAEQVVDSVASRIVAEVAPPGRAEAVSEIANLLPLITICELLGVPAEREPDVIQWVNESVGAADPEMQRGRSPQETMSQATGALLGYF
ncbi:MAG: hypothetical protein OXG27_02925, partial [Chloroflexi bacterium]|nr:hypothetical protein [Chloroflexota bacterium]